MKRKSTVFAAVLLLAAIAGVAYWKLGDRGSGAGSGAESGDTAAPAPPTAPTPPPRDQASAAPPPAPGPVLADDDPVGSLRLEGQVIDEDERPVAGADILLDANPPRTAVSEDDGSFAFEELVPRRYALTARAGERAGGPVVHVLTASSEPVVITVAASASLAVTVIGPGGEPVAGAEVELRDAGSRTRAVDARGVATFTGVLPGFHPVLARAPGHGLARSLVQIPPGSRDTVEHRIQLAAGAPIAGRVVDESGAPVAGARVLARDASALLSLIDPRRDAVVTDRTGAFALPAMAAGTYRLTATHERHAPGSSDLVTADGARAIADVEIRLAAGGVIAGVVVTERGEPAPHATVRVAASDRAGVAGGDVRQSVADDLGNFRMTGLSRAQVTVIASTDAASTDAVDADLRTTAEVTDLRLVLSVDGAIAGVVVDEAGGPVAEAQVIALPDFLGGSTATEDFALRGAATAITGGGGEFALRGLAEGTYRVRATRSLANAQQAWLSGVQAATGDTDLRLVLARDGAIEGKVALDDGSAPGLFTVAVGFSSSVPIAGETGRFSVAAITPGTYDVTIRGPGFAARTLRDVAVEPGERTDVGTVVVSRGRTAAGRVVGKGGAPVAGATVIAADRVISGGDGLETTLGQGLDSQFNARRTTTGADGEFAIRGIGPGERLVVADHASVGRSRPASIAAGTAAIPRLELVLVPFGSVTGVVTAGGQPARGVTVTASPTTGSNHAIVVQTGDDGRYIIARIPDGQHRLTALLGGLGARSGGADVVVQGGRQAVADIEIPIGDVTVKVNVTGEGGAAIDLAQVFLFKGEVSPATGQAVQDAFLSLASSGGAMASPPSPTGAPVVFEKVSPGQYSLCVLPINGDMSDPVFLQRLQENAAALEVYCAPQAIAAAPLEQTFARAVPAMEPFPAPANP